MKKKSENKGYEKSPLLITKKIVRKNVCYQ